MEFCENSLTIHCDDSTMKPDHPTVIFSQYLRASLEKMGRPHPDLEFLKNLMEAEGSEDVQILTAKEPVGLWPRDPRLKKIGAMTLLNCETAFDSYGMAAFTRILGMDADKVGSICERGL